MTEIQKQQIHDLRVKGVGYKAIAAVLNISRDSVRRFCKRHEPAGDSRGEPLSAVETIKDYRLCACCNKPIKQKGRGRSRRFCSDECRRKWWNDNPQERNRKETAIYSYTCQRCVKEFSSYGNKKRKYCSHECYIKSRFWDEEDVI